MDRLQPLFLNRAQLESFLGKDPQLIRAFETFVRALSTGIPDELEGLSVGLSMADANANALADTVEQEKQSAQAAQVLALSAQVEQMREQIAELSQYADPTLPAAIAVLREELSSTRSSAAMKPKRVAAGSITLSGTTFGTYTFSPAITGMVELRWLGTQTTATTFSQASVGISISGSTVTATRLVAGGTDVTVNFQITEYEP